MAEHESPASIMDEKPLSPAARAGLVVNAAFTILLFTSPPSCSWRVLQRWRCFSCS